MLRKLKVKLFYLKVIMDQNCARRKILIDKAKILEFFMMPKLTRISSLFSFAYLKF